MHIKLYNRKEHKRIPRSIVVVIYLQLLKAENERAVQYSRDDKKKKKWKKAESNTWRTGYPTDNTRHICYDPVEKF